MASSIDRQVMIDNLEDVEQYLSEIQDKIDEIVATIKAIRSIEPIEEVRGE